MPCRRIAAAAEGTLRTKQSRSQEQHGCNGFHDHSKRCQVDSCTSQRAGSERRQQHMFVAAAGGGERGSPRPAQARALHSANVGSLQREP